MEAWLAGNDRHIINDLRRDLRLGMGPCQGGFCAFRAAGILFTAENTKSAEKGSPLSANSANSAHSARSAVKHTNSALLEFLQERWKGLKPVMWGASLRQLELDLNIYRNLLGADRLPTARDPEVYPT